MHGPAGMEKTLTKLALPVGAAWLLIGTWTLYTAMHRSLRSALPSAALWLLFTLCATSPLPDACLRYLETRERFYQPSSGEPLDAVLVLGGGTVFSPRRPAVACSGDRVVHGAELYMQGQIRRLLTSGSPLDGLAENASKQTTEIWTKLGIPREAITQLDARNTSEEIAALKKWLDSAQSARSADRPLRIGVLTSAWHLPRAMRLARAQGFEPVAIAADYRSYEEVHFADRLPTGRNLDRLAVAAHEFLAALVNR